MRRPRGTTCRAGSGESGVCGWVKREGGQCFFWCLVFHAPTLHHTHRWDCHGLPVEYEIDKTLGITKRQDVLDMGIDK